MKFDEIGVVNDTPRGWSRISPLHTKCHSVWWSMIYRCYVIQERNKTYKDVYVCDEWLKLSNFSIWYMENYIEGGHLDKDIKGIVDDEGNKYYSPKTCMIVPPEVNYKEKWERLKNGVEYYETHPISRKGFKGICKRRHILFEEFEEYWVGEYAYNSKNKIFLYYHKSSPTVRVTSKRYKKNMTSVKDYEVKSVQRSHFKNSCVSKGVIFEDYIEVWLGERQGHTKLFRYYHKDFEGNIPTSYAEVNTEYTKSYETKLITRVNFKIFCRRHKIVFEDFVEVWFGDYIGRDKKFHYYHKETCSEW